jgi:H+/Cl- antiporter ClcA
MSYDLTRGARRPSRYDREVAVFDAIGDVTRNWPGWLELLGCYLIACIASWFIPTAELSLLALVLLFDLTGNENPAPWFLLATAIGGAVLLAGFLASDRQAR